MALQKLQQEWSALYREQLPRLAKARDPNQPKWPVFLDHCFARIILDNAVGRDRPWTSVVKSPAVKHMTEAQLQASLKLGHEIAQGKASLQDLDERSLALRGKTKGGAGTKRPSCESRAAEASASKKVKAAQDQGSAADTDEAPTQARPPTRKDEMADVWASFRKGPATTKRQGTDDEEQVALDNIRERIASDDGLSNFRKRVLTLLTEVPRGRYTTYKAIASGVGGLDQAAMKEAGNQKHGSSARAVGSAMRNNPFAPTVPCHRVLAADGKLGGFGGDWGPEGRFANEKREMLRAEGVRFDGKGKVIGSPFTAFKL